MLDKMFLTPNNPTIFTSRAELPGPRSGLNFEAETLPKSGHEIET